MNQNFLIYKIGQEKLSFAKQFTVIRYFTDTLQVLYGIRYERLHSSFASFCTKAAITEHQSSSSFAVSIFTGLWHFIAVHVYRKQIQQYSFISNTKTNNCPYSCCEAKKDIGMIYLQVTYDQHVITATPRQTYIWCTIIVRWKHGFYGHCTLQVATHLKIVSQDWHVKRPFVLRCALNP